MLWEKKSTQKSRFQVQKMFERVTFCKNCNTLRSLKKTEFLAQSTCENRFWSSTLHMSSNKSTSHWLYVWFWRRPNSEACHSRSSTVDRKSRIMGLVLSAATAEVAAAAGAGMALAVPWAAWWALDCSPNVNVEPFGLELVVELAAQSFWSRVGLLLGLLLCRWLLAVVTLPVMVVPADDEGAIRCCWPAPCWFAWVVTRPTATAAGDGDESGDEVRLDTWGIWISCLMCRNGVTAEG